MSKASEAKRRMQARADLGRTEATLFAQSHPPEPAYKPKRKNTSAKGALAERRAVAILESQGYEVERAPKVVAWISGQPRSKRHDFWGCIDLIALSGDPRMPETRLVQVGRKQDMRAKERELEAFALRRKGTEASVEVWGFVPGRRPNGQRFKVTAHNGLEWAEMSDEVCLVETKAKRAMKVAA